MLSIDVAMYEYVANHPLLVPVLNGRVYPALAPTQAVFPYLVYLEVGYYAARHLLGLSAPRWSQYQWEIHGTPHAQVGAVKLLLTKALDAFHGVVAGVDIRQVYVRDRRSMSEDDRGGGQQQLTCAMLDMDVLYFVTE